MCLRLITVPMHLSAQMYKILRFYQGMERAALGDVPDQGSTAQIQKESEKQKRRRTENRMYFGFLF